MSKRKQISKRIRFEVFKRDEFTCQYCGNKSPEVILHVDHMLPVSKGGGNDLLNLITSCESCNFGKSDVPLSDATAVQKQYKQLQELEQKRHQIEAMIQWRKDLEAKKESDVDFVIDSLNGHIWPHSAKECVRVEIKKHIKKYGMQQVFDAIQLSVERYLTLNESGDVTKESAETTINKIQGILYLRNAGPITQKLSYIKGVARNRFNYFDYKQAAILLNSYLYSLKNCDFTEEEILDDLELDLLRYTKECPHWTNWKNTILAWTDEMNTKAEGSLADAK